MAFLVPLMSLVLYRVPLLAYFYTAKQQKNASKTQQKQNRYPQK